MKRTWNFHIYTPDFLVDSILDYIFHCCKCNRTYIRARIHQCESVYVGGKWREHYYIDINTFIIIMNTSELSSIINDTMMIIDWLAYYIQNKKNEWEENKSWNLIIVNVSDVRECKVLWYYYVQCMHIIQYTLVHVYTKLYTSHNIEGHEERRERGRKRERNHYVCWVQVVVLFFFSCAIIIVVIVDVVFCCCCCCCVCGREFLRATHICMVVDVFIWLRRMIQTKKKFCAQNGVNVRKQMIIIKVVVVE